MLPSKLIVSSLEKYASEALHAEDSSSFLKYLKMYLEQLFSDGAFFTKVNERISRLPIEVNDEGYVRTDSIYVHFMNLKKYHRLIIEKEHLSPTIDGYYDDLFLSYYRKFSEKAYPITEARAEVEIPEDEVDVGEYSPVAIFDAERTQHSLRIFHNWLMQTGQDKIDHVGSYILKSTGDFTIVSDNTVYRDGRRVNLSPQLFRLTTALLMSPKGWLSKLEVKRALWCEDHLSKNDNDISKRVSDANRCLKRAGGRHDHIQRDNFSTGSYKFVP